MRHYSNVCHFFSGAKRSQLKIINLTNGTTTGFVDLCQFLNLPCHSKRLGPFPHITSETENLCAMEFNDSTRKIGLLYLFKSRQSGGGSGSGGGGGRWIRRRCLLVDRKLYIYRRPTVPLGQWEDCYDVEHAEVGDLIQQQPIPTQPTQEHRPTVAMELCHLTRLTARKHRSTLVLGLSDRGVLLDWKRALQCC